MASAKVQFSLETLTKRALENIDHEIALKEAECAAADDIDQHLLDVSHWRTRQANRLDELAENFAIISDADLEKFRIEPAPTVDLAEIRRCARQLDALRKARENMIVKSASLVADADGNVALTRVQLREFFNLD